MSVVVNIHQVSDKKKKITLKELEEIVISEQLYYGVPNQAYCLESYTGKKDIQNQLFVLFSRKTYGRGMSFLVDDDYNIELVLNYPATNTDIEVFYHFIKSCCEKLELETFLEEGEEYSLFQIEGLKQEVKTFNQKYIRQELKEGLTIFGCIYPITIEKSFIKSVQIVLPERVTDLFELYLDKKQKQDCYFAKPIIYTNNQDDSYYARYALTEDVPSIFPLEPYLPFGYDQDYFKKIKSWNVAIIEHKNQEFKMTAEIPYTDFKKMIDKKKYPIFDAKHIIVTVDKNMFKKIENYKIEQAKKKLSEWLSDFRELGQKPARIEYTNSFEEGEISCMIFKYKKTILSKWLLGIVSDSGTFSEMKEYHKEAEIEDAKEIVTLLKELWQRQAKKIEQKEKKDKQGVRYE